MEGKITSSGLAAMIALATGKQKQLCEDFVSALFRLVGRELLKGENVRIKGFGTFKLVDVEPRKSVNVVTGEDYEIPGHTKVVFVMAKELAAVVNEPFEAFETVEISDELPTDTLDGEVEVPDVIPETNEEEIVPEEPDDIISEDSEEITQEEPEDIAYDEPLETAQEEPEEIAQEEPEEIAQEEPEVNMSEEHQEYAEIEPSDDEEPEDQSFWKRYKFVIGFVAGVCASFLIGWVSISLAEYLNHEEKVKLTANENVAAGEAVVGIYGDEIVESDSTDLVKTHNVADSISRGETDKDDVPTRESDEPVYDTVSTTRYLTTIAKEHYGNFNLWPIIYEENAAILGHPDRIRPGTKVVVPPLSKYGVDPKNKEQIKAIKQKGNAIYAKYK